MCVFVSRAEQSSGRRWGGSSSLFINVILHSSGPYRSVRGGGRRRPGGGIFNVSSRCYSYTALETLRANFCHNDKHKAETFCKMFELALFKCRMKEIVLHSVIFAEELYAEFILILHIFEFRHYNVKEYVSNSTCSFRRVSSDIEREKERET